MVFQSYALWPHMTVRKNIGYPLKARKLRGPATKDWVEETAALVDCSALLDRYPGPAQRRPAAARRPRPWPRRPPRRRAVRRAAVSNLDARLRDQVRAQLHELHAAAAASAPCSSPTTRPRRSPSPTGWRSCGPGASSRSAPRSTCSRSRPPSTWPGSSGCPTGCRSSAATDGVDVRRDGGHRRAATCRADPTRSPCACARRTCSSPRPSADVPILDGVSFPAQVVDVAVRWPPHGRRRQGAGGTGCTPGCPAPPSAAGPASCSWTRTSWSASPRRAPCTTATDDTRIAGHVAVDVDTLATAGV